MAHNDTTGRIYIDTSGATPVGVSIGDVQSVLGTSANDVGRLCRSSLINKNSLHKPVRSNQLAVLSDAQFGAVDWGYRIPGTAPLAALIGYMNDEAGGTTPSDWSPLSNGETSASDYDYLANGWWYKRPRGVISTEPFRLRDFEEYMGSTEYLFKMELARTTVDSGAFFVDLYANIDLANPNFYSFDNTNGMMFLVAIVKEGEAVSTAKFKSAPTDSITGSYIYSAVEFTSAEVGDSTSSEVFTGGTGNYYVYGFLVSRSYLNGGTDPVQNLHESGNYRQMSALTGAIALPCARQTVSVVATPVVDPMSNLTFTFASGGTIAYIASAGRFNVSFPALSVANSGNSQKSFDKSNIFLRIGVYHTGNTWYSSYLNMSLSGSTSVPASGSATVFSSASKVLSDTSIIRWLQNEGCTISECVMTAYLYYYDPDTTDYWSMPGAYFDYQQA